jgi:redox-sensitive bicupin YhaK (pirin superfamily)
MRTLRKIVKSHLAEVQGIAISRALPSDTVRQVSPFLLLDHLGPMTLPPDQPLTIEDHPHRGFEPVTFLFGGSHEHRDSSGGHGFLESGDVQWMTAGSGVVHSEASCMEDANQDGRFHAVQLWVNLPSAHKMTPPKYQDIKAREIPVSERGGVRMRLVAGELDGLLGPASTFTPILLAHGIARSGGAVEIPVPPHFNAAVYVIRGSLRSNGETIDVRKLAWFDNNGSVVPVFAPEDAEFLLLSGEPIDEPLATFGPFVMNTPEEIELAIEDYDAGRMGRLG